MSDATIRLNLGSGPRSAHKAGFVNVDQLPDADVRCDLGRAIWPWPDRSVAHIRADNLFEHFDNDEFRHALNESHRVLTPRGVLWFRVPDAELWMDGAFGDPTHKRFFVPRSFYYFAHQRDQWKHYGKHYGFLPWDVTVLRVQNRFFEATCTPVK